MAVIEREHPSRSAGVRRGGAALGALLALGSSNGCQLLRGFESFSLGEDAAVSDASLDASVDGDDADGPSSRCGSVPLDAVELAATVRTCVLIAGCLPVDTLTVSVSSCITNYRRVPSDTNTAQDACFAAARSCADVTGCAGISGPTVPDCPFGGSPSRCEGSRAIDCTVGHKIVTDCALQGGQCSTDPVDAGASTTSVGCVVASCTEADGVSACRGDLRYTCRAGRGFGANCSMFGETCIVQGATTTCAPRMPASGVSGAICVGAVVNECREQTIYTYDCSKAGLRCEESSAGAACVAPECTIADTVACHESCKSDGKTASFCVGGSPYLVDCTKYGFVVCDEYDGSDGGAHVVRCR